ncbi:MAG: cysteine--tRNA ligase, partial [Clostridiaceae bacterium]|nr:cysteine--tRNA ligase [Clostridiaceae bacterium]
ENLIELKDKFINAMEDDLNTADAIAAVFDIVREVNLKFLGSSGFSRQIIEFSQSLIKELGGVLGIACKQRNKSIDSEIQELVDKRQQARKDKDWKLADEIRDKLKDMGITLEDTPQGVKIVRKDI